MGASVSWLFLFAVNFINPTCLSISISPTVTATFVSTNRTEMKQVNRIVLLAVGIMVAIFCITLVF
jgi:hypothetical protein